MAAARLVSTTALTACGDAGVDVDRIAHELGWDHARHGLTPPREALRASASLRRGHALGQQRFAGRTLAATAGARQWLALRVQAWLRARAFDTLTVTPHYLGQLATSHCPVTRALLTHGTQAAPHGAPTDAVVARICDDAGYASGNLAMLSLQADLAKAGLDWEDAWTQARQPAADSLAQAAWRRLAVLMSYTTALDHVQAAQLPLLVLPPNRLHVRNPIQGLQVLATLMLARSGWSTQLNRFLSLLGNDALRESFQRFFVALLPRVIGAGHPTDAQRRRWALEDAWREPEVLRLWQRFALQLDAPRAQALLERATTQGLLRQRALLHSEEQDTEGWSLETRGYLRAAANDPLPPSRALTGARQMSLPMGV